LHLKKLMNDVRVNKRWSASREKYYVKESNYKQHCFSMSPHHASRYEPDYLIPGNRTSKIHQSRPYVCEQSPCTPYIPRLYQTYNPHFLPWGQVIPRDFHRCYRQDKHRSTFGPFDPYGVRHKNQKFITCSAQHLPPFTPGNFNEKDNSAKQPSQSTDDYGDRVHSQQQQSPASAKGPELTVPTEENFNRSSSPSVLQNAINLRILDDKVQRKNVKQKEGPGYTEIDQNKTNDMERNQNNDLVRNFLSLNQNLNPQCIAPTQPCDGRAQED